MPRKLRPPSLRAQMLLALGRQRGSRHDSLLGEDEASEQATRVAELLQRLALSDALLWLIEYAPSPRWQSWLRIILDRHVRTSTQQISERLGWDKERAALRQQLTIISEGVQTLSARLEKVTQQNDDLQRHLTNLEANKGRRLLELEDELESLRAKEATLEERTKQDVADWEQVLRTRHDSTRLVLEYLHGYIGHQGPLRGCFHPLCRPAQHLLDDWDEERPLGGQETLYEGDPPCGSRS